MRTALLFATALLLLIASCMASSHSESPSTAKTPNADITDLYVFRSYETGRDNFITFIMNVYPLQNPIAGPNYYSISDNHFFEINIDNNGDGVEDYIYQFLYGNEMGGKTATFMEPDDDPCGNGTLNSVTKHAGLTIKVANPSDRGGNTSNDTPIALKFIGPIKNVYDPSLNWYEYYSLTKITGSRSSGQSDPVSKASNTSDFQFPKPFDYAGQKTFDPTTNPYSTYAAKHEWDINVPGCSTSGSKVFVGQRAESFSIQLGKIFDLINIVPVEVGTFAPSSPDVGTASCKSNNELAGLNVASFVLELPIDCLVSKSDVIGVWATVRNMVHVGNQHTATNQVSRLGNPLVNELVIGLRDKPIWSQAEPIQDVSVYGFAPYVLYPSLPAIVDVLFLSTIQSIVGSSLLTLAPNVPRTDLVQLFFGGIPGLNSFGPTSTDIPLVEYIRLNTSTDPTRRGNQLSLGVIGGDAAGYPNGRRLGDDVVDISLRVLMGKLCDPTIALNCTSDSAPVYNVGFTDGSPQHATQFQTGFPWMNTPNPGSVTNPSPSVCPSSSSS